jgi:hypothetical protein
MDDSGGLVRVSVVHRPWNLAPRPKRGLTTEAQRHGGAEKFARFASIKNSARRVPAAFPLSSFPRFLFLRLRLGLRLPLFLSPRVFHVFHSVRSLSAGAAGPPLRWSEKY